MKKSLKQPQCFALAVIVAMAVTPLWIVAVAIGFAPFNETSEWYCSKRLIILRDGTAAVWSDNFDTSGNWTPRVTYRTVDGKVLKNVTSENEYRETAKHSALLPPTSAESQGDDTKLLRAQDRIREVGRASDSGKPCGGEIWYLLHDGQSRGCLVGYDMKTKLLIGYIGHEGFSTKEPPPEKRFHINAQRMRDDQVFLSGKNPLTVFLGDRAVASVEWSFGPCLIDNGELLRIDRSQRTVIRLRKVAMPCYPTVGFNVRKNCPTVDCVDSDGRCSPLAELVLLRYRNHVSVLDRDGKLIQTYPLPETLWGKEIGWIQLEDNRAVAHMEDATNADDVYWYAPSGKIVRHESVDLLPSTPSPEDVAAEKRFQRCFAYSLTAPCGAVPGVLGGLACTMRDLDKSVVEPTEFGGAMLRQWPGWLAIAGFSVFWALLCFRRQRRHGLRRTWLWVPFVLLFGLPAYVGYLAQRKWPARLPCSHCGRRVPRDRPACLACGREFPAPTMKGIEVFA